MKVKFQYNRQKSGSKSSTILFFLGAICYVILGVLFIVLERDVLWISRMVSGLVYFLIGIIGLTLSGVSILLERKYLIIDEEKLIWKPGFFQRKTIIRLEMIEKFQISEEAILIFLEDKTQYVIDKNKIISTKKKKELDRMIEGLRLE